MTFKAKINFIEHAKKYHPEAHKKLLVKSKENNPLDFDFLKHIVYLKPTYRCPNHRFARSHCKWSTQDKSKIDEHQKTCQRDTDSGYYEKSDRSKSNGFFSCIICEKEFTDLNELKSHSFSEHPTRKYFTSKCYKGKCSHREGYVELFGHHFQNKHAGEVFDPSKVTKTKPTWVCRNSQVRGYNTFWDNFKYLKRYLPYSTRCNFFTENELDLEKHEKECTDLIRKSVNKVKRNNWQLKRKRQTISDAPNKKAKNSLKYPVETENQVDFEPSKYLSDKSLGHSQIEREFNFISNMRSISKKQKRPLPHFICHNNKDSTMKCEICESNFTSTYDLIRHRSNFCVMVSNLELETNTCNFCQGGELTSLLENSKLDENMRHSVLLSHKRLCGHSEEGQVKILKCGGCLAEFEDIHTFAKHTKDFQYGCDLLYSNELSDQRCFFCLENFTSVRNAVTHITRKCALRSENYSADDYEHIIQLKSKVSLYICK